MKSVKVFCLILILIISAAGCTKKENPLCEAAQGGDVEKIGILISEGADVNVKGEGIIKL